MYIYHVECASISGCSEARIIDVLYTYIIIFAEIPTKNEIKGIQFKDADVISSRCILQPIRFWQFIHIPYVFHIVLFSVHTFRLNLWDYNSLFALYRQNPFLKVLMATIEHWHGAISISIPILLNSY